MSPPVGGAPNPNKIKGGKWTVALFFIVSVGYTVAWMTFSSLLGYYAQKYNPSILLLMNIAYFLPSIPLLVASGFWDDWLDEKFGVAQTILTRLLVGMTGCALICALFPFCHDSARSLLLAVVGLGLLQAIAFSASYQMVARFANKNVVSLGLGCVGSGLVTLLLETVLYIGATPSHKQLKLLFELTAAVIVVGLLASVSLVTRHWRAIEAWSGGGGSSLQDPLLSANTSYSPNPSGSGLEALTPGTMAARMMRKSEPQMLVVVNPLGWHFDTEQDLFVSEIADRMFAGIPDDELRAHLPGSSDMIVSEAPREASPLAQEVQTENLRMQLLQRMVTEQDRAEAQRQSSRPIIEEIEDGGPRPPPPVSPFADHDVPALPHATPASHAAAPAPLGLPPAGAGLDTLSAVWPSVLALFLSGTFFVLVFPFFTYIPAKGGKLLPKEMLPKVLFFVRLFADVIGRMAPRSKALAIKSQVGLLSLGCLMASTLPLFFWYIGGQDLIRNDALAVVYIGLTWALGGYINTSCYTVAPQCVEGTQKAMANGLLALTYQVAHTFGLLLAVFLASVIFGDLTPKSAAGEPPSPPLAPTSLSWGRHSMYHDPFLWVPSWHVSGR